MGLFMDQSSQRLLPLQVNEEGAEAAAASGVKEVFCSVSPKFNVDHPFLFFIVSDTGYPVFMGHIVKPECKL